MKRKILVFIPNLEMGGAEKICITICNYLVKSDPSVTCTIACLKATGSFIQLADPSIKIIDLDHPSVYLSIGKILSVTKKEKPDIIISWMGYLNAYIIFFKFLFPKKIKWLCRESSLPSKKNIYFKVPWFFNFLYKFYNKYDKIICQSEAMANDLKNNFKVPPQKIKIINNPVQLSFSENVIGAEKQFPDTKYKLLFVGRLAAVKRVELLISVMCLLDDNYSLTIVGEGPERKRLEELVSQQRLTNKIKWIGPVSHPLYYYENASCLLISSLYEGFPNAIIEALSAGCPVIGYQIQGGADEILKNYGGIHLPEGYSISNFADKIKKVCESDPFIKEKIINECLQRFSLDRIGMQYHQLLFNTTK